MSRTVTAYRHLGTTVLTKTLELPVEPAMGMLVELDSAHAVAIKTMIVRPIPNPWTPGIKTPSVTIHFYEEPGLSSPEYLAGEHERGWAVPHA